MKTVTTGSPGRVDDVLNISGHRLGTAEVEGAIGQHETVAEAAVVGYPHEIKGQGIYAYVTLMSGVSPSDEIETGIKGCGSPAYWTPRDTGQDSIFTRTPQNPLRQNYAAHPSENR